MTSQIYYPNSNRISSIKFDKSKIVLDTVFDLSYTDSAIESHGGKDNRAMSATASRSSIKTMPARSIRAHGPAFAGVVEIPNGPYLVPSSRIEGHRYTVQSDGSGCNCPDHLYRGVVCKHMTGVRLAAECDVITKGEIKHVPAKSMRDPFANFDENR